jgi:hypothetical protein
MRVWIDLTNSPHVVFFRPLVRLLRERGHDVRSRRATSRRRSSCSRRPASSTPWWATPRRRLASRQGGAQWRSASGPSAGSPGRGQFDRRPVARLARAAARRPLARGAVVVRVRLRVRARPARPRLPAPQPGSSSRTPFPRSASTARRAGTQGAEVRRAQGGVLPPRVRPRPAGARRPRARPLAHSRRRPNTTRRCRSTTATGTRCSRTWLDRLGSDPDVQAVVLPRTPDHGTCSKPRACRRSSFRGERWTPFEPRGPGRPRRLRRRNDEPRSGLRSGRPSTRTFSGRLGAGRRAARARGPAPYAHERGRPARRTQGTRRLPSRRGHRICSSTVCSPRSRDSPAGTEGVLSCRPDKGGETQMRKLSILGVAVCRLPPFRPPWRARRRQRQRFQELVAAVRMLMTGDRSDVDVHARFATVGEMLPARCASSPFRTGSPCGRGATAASDVYVNHETSLVPFPYNPTAPTEANSPERFSRTRKSAMLALNQHSAGRPDDEAGRSRARRTSNRFCSSFLAWTEQGFDRALLFTNEEAVDWVNRTGKAWPATIGAPEARAGRRRRRARRQVGREPAIWGLGRLNHENTVAVQPVFSGRRAPDGRRPFTRQPVAVAGVLVHRDDADASGTTRARSGRSCPTTRRSRSTRLRARERAGVGLRPLHRGAAQ